MWSVLRRAELSSMATASPFPVGLIYDPFSGIRAASYRGRRAPAPCPAAEQVEHRFANVGDARGQFLPRRGSYSRGQRSVELQDAMYACVLLQRLPGALRAAVVRGEYRAGGGMDHECLGDMCCMELFITVLSHTAGAGRFRRSPKCRMSGRAGRCPTGLPRREPIAAPAAETVRRVSRRSFFGEDGQSSAP